MKGNLEKELRQALEGDVRTDQTTLCAYSVDASIYEIEPLIVVTPKNKEDIQKTLRLAFEYRVPVIARGAATGITGGCLGKGVILDLSKHVNKILQINIEDEYVVCEPGVVQDDLNARLSPYGYRLGPDTSTGNRATIGGMLANNAAGAHSLLYGKMVDHVLEVEVAMADGELISLKDTSMEDIGLSKRASSRLGALTAEIDRIRDAYREDIVAHFPKIPRRVSGYNLDELVKPGPLNLAKLIAGSEGTLGIATAIKLRISPKLGATGLCIVHCAEMTEGMKKIPQMLAHEPISLEMIDRKILEMARLSPSARHKIEWLQGAPEAIFIAEFQDPDLKGKLDAFQEEMTRLKVGYACEILESHEQIKHVWDVRKAGLGLLLSKRTYSRAIAFLEDLSLPPESLPDFIARFREYLASCDKEAGIYGHVGAGCMHIRPYIDLRSPKDLKLMHQMMLDVSTMVLESGGALSGEHGDGLIRSWLNEKMFGQLIYKAFCEVKAAFDPFNQLNPGKIVNGPPPQQNLRVSPDTNIQTIQTFQDFSPEGGFALAADLCNGNGLCRKPEGLMCPSFQATGDEFDTTRARAQALRAVINGRWQIEDFTSEKVGSVLDLCLECKGCKSECPSQVDMAKMKAEFLYQYQEKHGYSLRSKLFGHIGALYSYAQPIAGLFNAFGGLSFTKALLSFVGIARERALPKLATQRFSSWLKGKASGGPKQIVLFNDTYTEFNQPEVGKAAFRLLSALGYDVIVPPWTCCGRPLISKGLLRQARAKAESLVDLLHAYAARGIPILGLEPSCILTIADDLPSIASPETRQKALKVAGQCVTFDQFLNAQLSEGKLSFPQQDLKKEIFVHGHCHEKALVGATSTLNVLRAIPKCEVSEIPSGCCGMAGSFGYEKEHYALSMKIGSLHLFPAIQAAPKDAIIVANGFSCRHQIRHGTNRPAVHLAEALAHFHFDIPPSHNHP